jgi:acetyl-CoA decarbonylase/synthase complex subunit gamma
MNVMNKIENSSGSGDMITLPVIQAESSCCGMAKAASGTPPSLDQAFVTGSISTTADKLPRVSSTLRWQDYWGSIKARWGIGRMNYAVDPGLYALGDPDSNSPVLVTANYKMSFDRLREALPGRDAWILVLDTKGINVWCAAGKGTFGTDELIKKIESSRLKDIVSHRKLIIPQLGAPGVAAHKVKQVSGFKVYYGPIRAKDIAAYLDADLKTTAEMRIITFPLKDRVVLIPLELIETIKPFLIIAPILFLLGGIGGPSGFWANAFN